MKTTTYKEQEAIRQSKKPVSVYAVLHTLKDKYPDLKLKF